MKPVNEERLNGIWSATPTPFTNRMRIKKITCWMPGLKHLLVKMGLFRTTNNFLNYPLTPACRQAIARALVRKKEVLFP